MGKIKCYFGYHNWTERYGDWWAYYHRCKRCNFEELVQPQRMSMKTYEELSVPFRTRTIPDRYWETKRNPLYRPVYPTLEEALMAKKRIEKKIRTPEYDCIYTKICNEVFWYETA